MKYAIKFRKTGEWYSNDTGERFEWNNRRTAYYLMGKLDDEQWANDPVIVRFKPKKREPDAWLILSDGDPVKVVALLADTTPYVNKGFTAEPLFRRKEKSK